jgi:hypothetical protein
MTHRLKFLESAEKKVSDRGHPSHNACRFRICEFLIQQGDIYFG